MEIYTNRGEELAALSHTQPIMLVFLRHFGCTFCRETMSRLAENRLDVEAKGVRIVLVHMVATDIADEILTLYDLDGISHISDNRKSLYRRYGLEKTGLLALMGLPNWWRAFVAGLLQGHLVGKAVGDPFQMPGVFLLRQNRILNKFTYRYISDRPDFVKIAQVV